MRYAKKTGVSFPDLSHALSDCRELGAVAIRYLACIHSLLEPSYPLGGCSVRERVRHDVPHGLHLDFIIADGACGIQGLFDVTFFKDQVTLLGLVSPDAGIAVGLQSRATESSFASASLIWLCALFT